MKANSVCAWIAVGLWLARPAIGADGAGAGADAAAGKALFAQRCSLCHTAQEGDKGGAEGPSLVGVLGRAAARAPGFSYSAALRSSGLIWDAPTLTQFLAAPSRMVPGTTMSVAVPDPAERGDLVAYLAHLGAAPATTAPAAAAPAAAAPAATAPATAAAPSAAAASRDPAGDWRRDAPGKLHRVSPDSLAAPYATESARNNSTVVPKPANARLSVPRGFSVAVFASGLQGARKMLLAPNGDVIVTEISGGRISVLRPTQDGRRAAHSTVFAEGLHRPFGLAFYPNAQSPQWLYVAETDRVTRYAYQPGDQKKRGDPEVVIPQLPSMGGHSTRDIAFSPDGSRLFVSVGSGSNVAESMSKKSPAEVQAWESAHGLGAAWDNETDRAAVLEFDALAPAQPLIYAAGIRNCVSLTVQPAGGALWCTTNERDGLGDDLVPDYSTRVVRGSFFGWPWYYIGSHQDPRLAGERPDLAAKVSIPDVLYQSHSAALNMTFYVAHGGKSAFPADYVGDAFAAFHGSWNRSRRTGYKIVRVRIRQGEPTGDYQDFLTGFVVDDARVWGRPVATTELADGSLLVSEDGNNVIYRISHHR